MLMCLLVHKPRLWFFHFTFVVLLIHVCGFFISRLWFMKKEARGWESEPLSGRFEAQEIKKFRACVRIICWKSSIFVAI